MAEKLTYRELEKRIKELKTAANGRVSSEKQLEFLLFAVEQSSEGIAVVDLDGNLEYLNNAFSEMHGYSAEELAGKNLSIFHTPEQIPSVNAANLEIKQTGSFKGEIWHVKRDGVVFPTLMQNSLIRDDKGTPIGIMGTLRDITDIKQAEEALRQERDNAQKYLDIAGVIMVVINTDQKVTLMNKKGCQLLGFAQWEIIGKNWFDYFIPKKDREKTRATFTDLVAGGRKPLESFENYILTKDGQKRLIAWQNSILKNNKGEIIATLSSGEDITDRKKVEKEKIKAQKIAGEHEKLALVGQISGKMAHDFNNVLGIIMGNAQLALVKSREPKTKKALELIFNQTIRGKNLTKNLVAFANDQEPKQEFFRIIEKINLVENLLRNDLEGIEFIKEYKPGIPELLADPGMIEHAFVNLIQNSIHATSMNKSPRIIVRAHCLGENIYFEVEDNGCGIPKEHLEDIYKPSFTLKGTRDVTGSYKPGIKGTGYGMANVKKYIQQHRGNLSIVSEFGSGTKVIINLPVIKKELTSKEKIQLQEEIIQFEKYILLVEDEIAISDVQYKVLTQDPCKHQVDIAPNGQVAMDLLGRNEYDLISLDYILPGNTNGMDLYTHIRKTNKTIPILFISGNIEFLESIKELKQKDANLEHLSKPCQNKDYVNSINKLLGKALLDNLSGD